MNLNIRTATAEPSKAADAMAFAVDIAALVTKVTGVEILTWATLYGAPLGSVAWTWRTDSLADRVEMDEKLLANPDYTAKEQEGGTLFTGPVEDLVGEVVSAVGAGLPARYSTVISAQCQPGRLVDAMTWAVEIQEESSKLTGLDSLLVRPLYGQFATLSWITPAETLEQVDAAAALFGDPAFVASVDRGGPLFIPGQTVTTLSERLA